MNKLVTELQSKANAHVNELKPLGMYAWQQAYDAKFAELIVKECLQEVTNQFNGGREVDENTHSPDWNDAVECISAMINKRFEINKE